MKRGSTRTGIIHDLLKCIFAGLHFDSDSEREDDEQRGAYESHWDEGFWRS